MTHAVHVGEQAEVHGGVRAENGEGPQRDQGQPGADPGLRQRLNRVAQGARQGKGRPLTHAFCHPPYVLRLTFIQKVPSTFWREAGGHFRPALT